MRDRFVSVATELLGDDPRMAVVLADIGYSRFVDSGAVARAPTRLVNVGIREQLMIGVAAGMALEGLRPIVHSYAPFLVERPFEQLKLDLSHQAAGAILVSIGASYDAAGEGRTHQSPADVALVSTLPGWRIHVPGHPAEFESILQREAAGDGCAYIRLAEDANATPLPDADGSWQVVRLGNRAVVVAVGPMLDRVLDATQGLDVTVLYAATVRPVDPRALLDQRNSGDYVMVEPYLKGTTVAALAETLGDKPYRVCSIGVPATEHRHYGTRQEHDAAHGLDAPGIRARITAFLAG